MAAQLIELVQAPAEVIRAFVALGVQATGV
jgi:hypothetical protein